MVLEHSMKTELKTPNESLISSESFSDKDGNEIKLYEHNKETIDIEGKSPENHENFDQYEFISSDTLWTKKVWLPRRIL